MLDLTAEAVIVALVKDVAAWTEALKRTDPGFA